MFTRVICPMCDEIHLVLVDLEYLNLSSILMMIREHQGLLCSRCLDENIVEYI